MKKFLLALSIVAVSFAANAQSKDGGFHVAGGLHTGLVVGTYDVLYNFGVGGELQGEYNFAENISGTITSGYTSFFAKSAYKNIGGSAVGYIPVLAGIRFYPSSQFFVGAKLGLGILTGGGGSGSSSGFNYQPEIGFNGERFQVSVGYNGVSVTGGTFSHIGLSALYKFN